MRIRNHPDVVAHQGIGVQALYDYAFGTMHEAMMVLFKAIQRHAIVYQMSIHFALGWAPCMYERNLVNLCILSPPECLHNGVVMFLILTQMHIIWHLLKSISGFE